MQQFVQIETFLRINVFSFLLVACLVRAVWMEHLREFGSEMVILCTYSDVCGKPGPWMQAGVLLKTIRDR